MIGKMEKSEADFRASHVEENVPFAAWMVAQRFDRSPTLARGSLSMENEGNWVSEKALKRARLLKYIKPVEKKQTYVSANGFRSRPQGRINILWFATDQTVVREMEFGVLKDLPVDIMVGRSYIDQYNTRLLERVSSRLQSASPRSKQLWAHSLDIH